MGSLRGTPIYLGRSWFFIAVVIVILFGPQVHSMLPELGAASYVVALAYTLLLLLSVLVHEASHALVGQARGYRVDRIVADLWGGHTAYSDAKGGAMSSALVAGVGPVSNLVLAGLGWLALRGLPDVNGHESTTVRVLVVLLIVFVWANGIVGLFNLLPGLPLDGGFLLEALVWRITGSRATGMRVAGWCGRIVALGVVYWLVVRPILKGESPSATSLVWIVLIGMFLWQGAGQAVAGGRGLELLGRVRVQDVLRPVALEAGSVPISAVDSRDTAVLNEHRVPTGFAAGEAILVARSQAPSAPLSSVAVIQPPGWIARVDGPDADVVEVVRAVQDATAHVTQVLVVDPDHTVLGIVRIDELNHALRTADRQGRPTP